MSGRWLVAIGLGAVLATTGARIARKERILAEGEVVYLELEARDPRSLVQGDYMRLRYRQVGELHPLTATAPTDGHLVADLDASGVIEDLRLPDGGPLEPDERLVPYRIRGGRWRVASEAWLFEEGTAPTWSQARYATLRLSPDGEIVLAGLADAHLAPLGPAPRRW